MRTGTFVAGGADLQYGLCSTAHCWQGRLGIGNRARRQGGEAREKSIDDNCGVWYMSGSGLWAEPSYWPSKPEHHKHAMLTSPDVWLMNDPGLRAETLYCATPQERKIAQPQWLNNAYVLNFIYHPLNRQRNWFARRPICETLAQTTTQVHHLTLMSDPAWL